MRWDEQADIVVAGSGSGALLAAAVAAKEGAEVIVLEKSGQLGGGTALSTGLVFVPNSAHLVGSSVADSREDALTYLRYLNQGVADDQLLEVFLDSALDMLKWLSEHSPLRLRPVEHLPDFYCDVPGGKLGGRHIAVEPFPAAELGEWAAKTRQSQSLPLSYHEIEAMGGPSNVRNWDFATIAERITADIRGQGAAIIAGLVKACLNYGAELRVNAPVKRLLMEGGRVSGVQVEIGGELKHIAARRGVILGTGGFEWNGVMNRHFIGHPLHGPLTVPTNEGDGHRMGAAVGGALGLMHLSAWTPVLRIPGEEYEGKPYWRNLASEKGRPYCILVNRRGERFVNENLPYAAMGQACHRFDYESLSYANLPMYFICDATYRERYPIATVMPGEPAPAWMAQASTPAELARQLGIDPDGLERTIKRFNEFCKTGKDEDFNRGSNAFQRYYGDSQCKPNPTLGPLENPPFYGFEVHVGTFGNRGGLVGNHNAQVLDVFGQPIEGLYACGNTLAQRVMGLNYEGGGTLAQSMTFGLRAARAALGKL